MPLLRHLQVRLVAVCALALATPAVAQGSDASPADGPSTEPFELVHEWREPAIASACAWSPIEPVLAVFDRRGAVRLRSTEDWEVVETLECPTAEFGCLAFSPDGRYLAAGGDRVIRIWSVRKDWKHVVDLDVITPEPEESDEEEFADEDGEFLEDEEIEGVAWIFEVRALCFGSNSQLLFIGGDSKAVEAWKTKDWSRAMVIGQPDLDSADYVAITSIDSAKRGRMLFTGSTDQFARAWDAKRSAWVEREVEDQSPHHHEGMDVDLSANGNLALVGTLREQGGFFELHDLKKSRRLARGPIRSGFVPQVALFADETRALVASMELLVVDTESGEVIRKFPLRSMTIDLAVSADGLRVAITGEDARVRVYAVGV
ncbi:MAG: WD40 repeat domain-containing protein [Planctomycetota bacterium]